MTRGRKSTVNSTTIPKQFALPANVSGNLIFVMISSNDLQINLDFSRIEKRIYSSERDGNR